MKRLQLNVARGDRERSRRRRRSARSSAAAAATRSTPGASSSALKPRDERTATATQIIDRLRPQLAKVEGVNLFLQPSQDITVGGRISRGQYQYTLQDADLDELNTWAPKMLAKLKTLPELADVSTRPAEQRAAARRSRINRDAAARFGIQPQVIDDTLNDAFGQRQVAQYLHADQHLFHRARGAARPAGERCATLDQIYVKAPRPGSPCRSRRWSTIDIDAGRAAVGLAPGPVPGGDAVVQPAAGRRARPGGRGDRQGRRPRSASRDR